jgi:hypothetical protein
MTVHIKVDGREIPFTLVQEKGGWRSTEKHEECVFPLITEVEGRRYELYSDETFAEVEK